MHALATPLMIKADGTKFGKTEGGAVWLDPELTTPYAFYQFWLNAEDDDVVDHLKVFTFLSREEIEELERPSAERPCLREAQRALAEEVTTLVHGDEADARRARCGVLALRPGRPRGLDAATLDAALAELPSVEAGGRKMRSPACWSRPRPDGIRGGVAPGDRPGGRVRGQRTGHRRGGRSSARPLPARPVRRSCGGASAPSRPSSGRPDGPPEPTRPRCPLRLHLAPRTDCNVFPRSPKGSDEAKLSHLHSGDPPPLQHSV